MGWFFDLNLGLISFLIDRMLSKSLVSTYQGPRKKKKPQKGLMGTFLRKMILLGITGFFRLGRLMGNTQNGQAKPSRYKPI